MTQSLQVFHLQKYFKINSNVYWIVGGLAKKGDKFLLSKNIVKILKHIFLVKIKIFLED